MRISRQGGFSVMELAIGAGISAALALAVLSLVAQYFKVQKAQKTALGMMQVRTDLEKTLSAEETFKVLLANAKTGGANAQSLSCLVHSADCSSAKGLALVLTDKNNNPVKSIADPNAPNEGLTADGAFCDTFDPINGNNKCPYRYELSWRALCPPAPEPCTKPSVEFVANLKIKTEADSKQNVGRLDPARFRISYLRKETNDKISDTCLSINGTINGANCETDFGTTCPAGQYIIGFKKNGTRICSAIKSFTCPVGQVLSSIKTDGSYACSPGCAASTASGGTWFSL